MTTLPQPQALPSQPEASQIAAAVEQTYPSPKYAWYVVIVLMLVYVSSFICRQILNLLVTPIRTDLELTDFEVSLLMGLVFAVFYTVPGLYFGKLADYLSRRSIIAAGLMVWSLFTAAMGLAESFLMMFVFRAGVGVGQSALSPPAYSLVTDYFPKHRRALAISVYSMGIYIGSGLAGIVGAQIRAATDKVSSFPVPLHGWQLVLIAVGLLGLPLILLVYTVREPARHGVGKPPSPSSPAAAALGPDPTSSAGYLWLNRRAILLHNLGFGVLSLANYASAAWIPTIFERSFQWTAAEAGHWYGIIVLITGPAGIILGGWMTDWLVKKGYRDGALRVGLFSTLAWIPTGALFAMVPSGTMAMWLLVPTAFIAAMPFGSAAASIQQIVPNHLRGRASSIYLFVVNLIGMGLGPSAPAVFNRWVYGDDTRIYLSLAIVATAAHLVSGVLLWWGFKPFRQSDERLQLLTAAK